MFATPIAYLIDEQGIIAADVAVGSAAITALATGKGQTMREQMQTRLEMLRKEYESGQVELQKVERQRAYLQETVFRITLGPYRFWKNYWQRGTNHSAERACS